CVTARPATGRGYSTRGILRSGRGCGTRGILRLRPRMQYARDPSLRLKSASAQDDAGPERVLGGMDARDVIGNVNTARGIPSPPAAGTVRAGSFAPAEKRLRSG